MKKHIVLIGLPGSGKSTVARLTARGLGAACIDVDEEIARHCGRSISEIFADQGETAFREMEAEHTRQVLDGPPAVIATGGGWPAWPGAVQDARGRALVVYLYIDPAEAALRTGNAVDRPLLAGDRQESLTALLGRRASFYELAEVTVAAGGAEPDEVAARVVTLARLKGGW